MSAVINNQGVLEIERAGELTEQICIYSDNKYCGDHCPAFGDLQKHTFGDLVRYNLTLCREVGTICNVQDMRTGEEDE